MNDIPVICCIKRIIYTPQLFWGLLTETLQKNPLNNQDCTVHVTCGQHGHLITSHGFFHLVHRQHQTTMGCSPLIHAKVVGTREQSTPTPYITWVFIRPQPFQRLPTQTVKQLAALPPKGSPAFPMTDQKEPTRFLKGR